MNKKFHDSLTHRQAMDIIDALEILMARDEHGKPACEPGCWGQDPEAVVYGMPGVEWEK